ncbi:MAG: peptidylprolyl isomerase [Polyangiales bacterium]
MAGIVADGKVVSLQYTLTDEEGEVIDQSDPGDPLLYLHGAGNIVPGLERQLEGKSVGTSLKAVVPPAEGYGEATGRVEKAPRSAFPRGVELEIGMDFVAEGPDGSLIPLFICDIEGEDVFVTSDHPLAGVELHFDVTITEVRDATPEEVEHGHPHGPHGHGHGH